MKRNATKTTAETTATIRNAEGIALLVSTDEHKLQSVLQRVGQLVATAFTLSGARAFASYCEAFGARATQLGCVVTVQF